MTWRIRHLGWKLLLGAMTCVSTTGTTRSASACICEGSTPSEAFEAADLVFEGRLEAACRRGDQLRDLIEQAFLKESGEALFLTVNWTVYYFKVERLLKGRSATSPVAIYTGIPFSGDCGIGFAAGRVTRIYAIAVGEHFVTGLCRYPGGTPDEPLDALEYREQAPHDGGWPIDDDEWAGYPVCDADVPLLRLPVKPASPDHAAETPEREPPCPEEVSTVPRRGAGGPAGCAGCAMPGFGAERNSGGALALMLGVGLLRRRSRKC